MKSKLIAYLLWFFLGVFSLHRFYLGKVGTGLIYLFTFQLLGIGWIVDLFTLSGKVDNYNSEVKIKRMEKNLDKQSKFNEAVATKISNEG